MYIIRLLRPRPRPRPITVVLSSIILAAAGCLVAVLATPALAQTAISVNGASAGRTFYGVGAISGGGGNTRLLTDYPSRERQQILDYMFKPGFGADLQILKVEIGGDTNSTDGSESSIEHSRGSVNCSAGYEFWLMEQAKALDPHIRLYGLAWGAPGWINGGFWSTDTIHYLITWLNCASSHHLKINYLGGWNERGFNVDWYIQLRAALDAAGYRSVQIVGGDGWWDTAPYILSNRAFADAVSFIGPHYPCEGNDGGSADTCAPNAAAEETGKPLWASENGSQDLNTGSPALIRSITRGYIDAELTAYINWPVVAALYPNEPYDTDGLVYADEPWSGWYTVGESTWATAMVTQFTAPGWRFLNSGSGYLGGSEQNGTFVTLKSTDGHDYSTIIETTTATTPQTVTVNVSGGMSTGKVHVWATAVNTPGSGPQFAQLGTIVPRNGAYSLTVRPGYIYTLTTTTGQHKGTAPSPKHAGLPLPYSDNFNSDPTGQQPRFLAQQQGAFEVEPCAGGRSGKCVQQQAPVVPIEWDTNANPNTFGGNLSWSNYTVSADALMKQPGAVQLLGRVGTQESEQVNYDNDYYLQLSNTGAWALVRNSDTGTQARLASGTVAAPGTGTWHHLLMTFNGARISAAIDGTTVATVTDASYLAGMVGFGTGGYQTDQFDNLSVKPLSATPSGSIVAGIDRAECVDVNEGSALSGTKVQLWDCDNDAKSQHWTMEKNGTIRINGRCLGVSGAGNVNGALIKELACTSTQNDKWAAVNGELVNLQSGRCLDDPASSTAAGTQLDLWACNGGTNQIWYVP
jgi:Glycosyl hydrolase family 59/Ricin-type beta-trefoil lectin domain/Concanavalin A-like lectin/glucanases superfamily